MTGAKSTKLLLAAAVVAGIATGVAGRAEAAMTTLDFTQYEHGTVLNFDVAGVSMSAFGGAVSSPVVFDPAQGALDVGNSSDPDLETLFGAPLNPTTPGLSAGPTNTIPKDFHLVIVQENSTGCGDGVCNDPDDDGYGPNGIIFDFHEAVTLNSIDLFDIDQGTFPETISFTLYHTGGTQSFVQISGNQIGNNRSATFDLGQFFAQSAGSNDQVEKLKVTLSNSGAVSNLKFTRGGDVPEPATYGVFGSALVALMLFGAYGRQTSAARAKS